MADVNTQAQIIQPPKENVTPPSARVFSMPARYRHGAVVHVVEPQKQSSPALAPTAPPIPVAPRVIPPPLNKPGVPAAHSKRAYLIAGGVVIIALGISGYLLFRSVQKNTPVPITPVPVVVPEIVVPVEEVLVEEPAPETEPSVPVTGSVSPFTAAVTPGVDSDSDGLTDIEEELVYGTEQHLPDTDGDGFLDGNEVFHHYNPNGTAPADLLGAALVQELAGKSFLLLYPTKWSVLPSEEGNFLISATTGETFSIESITKDVSVTLEDWYAQVIHDGTPNLTKSKNGFPMLVAKNQLTVYLDLGPSVLVFIYDTTTKGTIDYLQTFQMMLNSVEKPVIVVSVPEVGP